MNFDDYSAEAARIWRDESARTLVDAIGLCAEAGEAADHFKKQVGHGKPLAAMEVGAELGDALWYLDRLAVRAGFTLEEIAVMNTAKLRTRYPDGFQDMYQPKDEKKERVAMAIALRNHRQVWEDFEKSLPSPDWSGVPHFPEEEDYGLYAGAPQEGDL